MVMTNLTTGDKVVLYFQPCGWFGYDIDHQFYSCICGLLIVSIAKLFSFSTNSLYAFITVCWKGRAVNSVLFIIFLEFSQSSLYCFVKACLNLP
jgi:hypothetical protein